MKMPSRVGVKMTLRLILRYIFVIGPLRQTQYPAFGTRPAALSITLGDQRWVYAYVRPVGRTYA
ncbi:MAG: hypothetical protein SF053_15545 [Bacteroidia bacterium]|nr:hypothetical protein [Bacteroidia bacterium]